VTDKELEFIASGGIQHVNYWDSCAFFENGARLSSMVRMFGNKNIGQAALCNLDRAESNAPDVLVIRRWYARTNVDDSDVREAFVRWAHTAVVTLVMGDSLQWTLPLEELLARRPTALASEVQPRRLHDPWPLVVPARQNLHVRVSTIDSLHEELTSFYESRQYWLGYSTGRFWIHLEGVKLRMDRKGKAGASWAKLLGALMGFEERAIPAEEEIASWIRGKRVDGDHDGNAQLEALADGVLEHQARR